MNRLEAADLIEPMILEKLQEHSAEELFYKGQQARIPLARVPPWRNSLKSISTLIVMPLVQQLRQVTLIRCLPFRSGYLRRLQILAVQ